MGERLLGSVLQRSLRDQRRLLVGFAIGMLLFVGVIVAFYPTVRDQREQFEHLLDAYPPAMKTAFGITEIASATGFLQGELFSVMLPLLFLIFGIGRAADIIAGDEERGWLDALLTLPVSRRRALAGKVAGLATATGALALLLLVAVALGGALVGMRLSTLALVEETLLLLLLTWAFSAIALLVACWRGRKGVAISTASALAVAAYLLASFGALVPSLAEARKASPFYFYSGHPPLSGAFEPLDALGLLAIAAIATLASFWAFERRDVGVA